MKRKHWREFKRKVMPDEKLSLIGVGLREWRENILGRGKARRGVGVLLKCRLGVILRA